MLSIDISEDDNKIAFLDKFKRVSRLIDEKKAEIEKERLANMSGIIVFPTGIFPTGVGLYC